MMSNELERIKSELINNADNTKDLAISMLVLSVLEENSIEYANIGSQEIEAVACGINRYFDERYLGGMYREMRMSLDDKNKEFADRYKCEPVKEWYTNTFPDDTEGDAIRDNISFSNLYNYLKRGKGDFYKYIGNDVDSVIRERVFIRISELWHIDYNTVYDMWLHKQSYENNNYAYLPYDEYGNVDKFSMAKEIGEWYGSFISLNNKYSIDNGEELFSYENLDDLLVDWKETLIQDDTVEWSDYISFIENEIEQAKNIEPDITDDM